jgi:hypothetical protein
VAGVAAAPTRRTDLAIYETLGHADTVRTLFDVGQPRLVPGLQREIAQTMTGWEPIPGLT